ncbi:MAG: hypothetical protein JXB47_12080, partial [Anaerolineae bacterium]|nr:hypothetical protein [Anaerolineae bacterium]
MSKFTPQDLSDCFNAGRSDQDAALPWHPGLSSQFDAMPSGEQTAWGIPFKFSPHAPRWVVSGHDRTPAVLPLHGTANYVVIAHFCNASQRPTEGPTGVDWGAVTQPGEHLADYVLIYDDGSVHRVPIRRRYEINQPNVPWGHLAFAAAPYHQPKPVKLLEPEPEAGLWGLVQTGVWTTDGGYWLYALANPHPDKPLKEMRIEPTGADLLAVAGVTLFTGDVHPLRHERLESFRVKLPAREAVAPADLDIDIDLGIIARVRDVPPFAPDAWLAAEVQGWGEPHTSGQPKDTHILDIAASRAAALRIAGREVPMEDLFQPQGKVASADGQVSAEVLGYEKTWLRVTVEDEQGRPTPVRVHFRAPDGRYLPPYGHRHEVNPCWFEDYGADSKLGGTAYAYVPGTFEIELPVGEVYVEIAKGFEYAPLRRRLAIAPGQ